MEIKVYVTNLALYNEGYLHGEWLTLPTTEEEIEECMKRVLKVNGRDDEEYFITDYETELDIRFGEFENVYEINELLNQVEDYENDDLIAITESETGDLAQAIEILKSGSYEFYKDYDLRDLAEMFADGMNLPDFARNYFDYDAYARDLSFDGYFEASNGVIRIA